MKKTNKELTKIVVEKVMEYGTNLTMGQHPEGTIIHKWKFKKGIDLSGMFILKDANGNQVGFNCKSPEEAWEEYWKKVYRNFNPITSAEDNSKLKSEFIKKFQPNSIVVDVGRNGGVVDIFMINKDVFSSDVWEPKHTPEKERRAIVEAIAKAVMGNV